MATEAIIAIAAALCIVCSTIIPGLSQGKTATAAMESIARQPEAAGDIRSALIVSMALMEALTIYGLLVALMLIGKI
ncbi:MAG: ATP synthase F0 subunit C [Oscillospiraceae bacterium]|nr:ATP synthase F0 subunit C [Oscillospiraceae bacterium]